MRHVPRANRCILPGGIYHLIHWCYDRAFFLRFGLNRAEHCNRLRTSVRRHWISLQERFLKCTYKHLWLYQMFRKTSAIYCSGWRENPPLAHLLFWWSTMSARICIRRKGTACETAHCMVPQADVTKKSSTVLQKLQVALLFRRKASEYTFPEIGALSGEAPNPRIYA